MNRVYKVIWSHVKNAYVVVSELAGRSSKKSSRRHEYGKVLTAAIMTAIVLTGG